MSTPETVLKASIGIYLIGDLRRGGDLRLAGDRLSGGRGGLIVSQVKVVYFRVVPFTQNCLSRTCLLLGSAPDLPACPLPWLLDNWTFPWSTVVWGSLGLLESSNFFNVLCFDNSNNVHCQS